MSGALGFYFFVYSNNDSAAFSELMRGRLEPSKIVFNRFGDARSRSQVKPAEMGGRQPLRILRVLRSFIISLKLCTVKLGPTFASSMIGSASQISEPGGVNMCSDLLVVERSAYLLSMVTKS
jgi:hypothetical protein